VITPIFIPTHGPIASRRKGDFCGTHASAWFYSGARRGEHDTGG